MNTDPLTRRERELMDILYRLGGGTVSAVRAEMGAPPSYSAVRALLNILVDKGHLASSAAGRAYVYAPTRPREAAGASALQRVVEAFFGGSAVDAAVALVSMEDLSSEELSDLRAAIARAEQEGA